jgi:hypothetical protein
VLICWCTMLVSLMIFFLKFVLLVQRKLETSKFDIIPVVFRSVAYVWYHSWYVRIRVIHCDFPKATLLQNHGRSSCDSGILNVDIKVIFVKINVAHYDFAKLNTNQMYTKICFLKGGLNFPLFCCIFFAKKYFLFMIAAG